MSNRKGTESAFHVPLIFPLLLGTLAFGAIYFVVLLPPLRHPLVMRYALCHWVGVASAWLFCVGVSALVFKWWAARAESRVSQDVAGVLRGIVEARNDLDPSVARDSMQLGLWLDTLWRSQKSEHLRSWYGRRVTHFVRRQMERKSCKRIDDDLRELAELDAEHQHGSYAMIRIICWAMPMLGFLGTVLGISDTLGKMDAQALASGSQEAMNRLTAGLYVAFDTTAVGLVLTMVAMFLQFAVQRRETSLLTQIDLGVASAMNECLSVPEDAPHVGDVGAVLRAITEGLLTSVQQLVQKQSELWRDTISEAHTHWKHLSEGVAEATSATMQTAMRDSLQEYRQSMHVHLHDLVRLQTDGAQQIDSRLQQWQTTISEQARVTLRQQQEMNKHAELLQRLLDSSQMVGAMQGPIEATLHRLTDVDRFHDAAICLTEAVAVLGTQMERYGYLGRQPVRRRGPDAEPGGAEMNEGGPHLSVLRPDASNTDGSSESRADEPSNSPWKRKAG